MKTRVLVLIVVFLWALCSFGQKAFITTTFTATNGAQHVLLDSIYIENLTQGGDTILYAPDTVLVLEYVSGINDDIHAGNELKLFQNFPNPIQQQTSIHLSIPGNENVKIHIHNVRGEKLIYFEKLLLPGTHLFRFYPGNQAHYILSASNNTSIKAIQMVNMNRNSGQCKLVYEGRIDDVTDFKSEGNSTGFPFSPGDTLRYTAYARTLQLYTGSDVIEDSPQVDKTYSFEITTGIPCDDLPLLHFEQQKYRTVKIGTQCWMKENLNAGLQIEGQYDPSDNGLIEKYCYNDNPDHCDKYGGLYTWDELMAYAGHGTPDICPDGWHIPTNSDFTMLTKFLGDSDVAGGKMKEAGLTHWNSPNTGATNESGFSALPAGHHNINGEFWNMGQTANYWSSNFNLYGAERWYLNFDTDDVVQILYDKSYAYSARCIKDTYTWHCGDTIHDARDGQIYSTIPLNSSCWMRENLNIGTKLDGGDPMTDNGVIEKYCYDDQESNCDEYGGLYQWTEMMQYESEEGIKGICPKGWHLPSKDEWTGIIQWCGGEDITGGKLKEEGYQHWYAPNTGATNESEFTALPGGRHVIAFSWLQEFAFFWSSSEYNELQTQSWYYRLYFNEEKIGESYYPKTYAYSVRCIKGE